MFVRIWEWKNQKKKKKRKQNTECVGDLWVWGYLVRRKEWQKKVTTEFVVTDGEKGVSLLLGESSEKLEFLRVGPPSDVAGSLSQKLERNEKCRSLYSGLGKLKERKITLQAKHNVKPPIQEASRIQFSLRSKVEEKIAVLEALAIIERAEGRTSFVNPIVVVPKLNSSDIRLCVDCPPVRGLLSDVWTLSLLLFPTWTERFPASTSSTVPLLLADSLTYFDPWGWRRRQRCTRECVFRWVVSSYDQNICAVWWKICTPKYMMYVCMNACMHTNMYACIYSGFCCS